MENNRLFRMLLLLLEKKKATAPELARMFEISVRTVYRDIDRLSAAGIPVYTTTGKHGGIHLMDNYVMDKSLLSEEDQNEILMGLYSISAIPHLNSAHMLQRLTALFDHKLDWIEFNFSPWGSIPLQERELFNQVKQAILTNQLITFHYVNSDGEKSIPTVEPQKLIFKNSTWYFKGYIHDDPDRKEFETFKMKRITQLTFLARKHDHSVTAGSNDPKSETAPILTPLTLSFSSNIAYRVYDFFEPSLIKKEPDGRLRVSLELNVGEWLYSFLLSFGSELTVIEPVHVGQELLRRHIKAVEHLQNVMNKLPNNE
ncbi:helix-turn-helix transcriptional regulator [Paenibacillus sp. FSL H7-689]|uniref:helix-turn-helix transcriptional regulator n=1 Tax=Paenibacillus sp. FSL H7-689 TaxID=1227349 RepID=UPI0004ACABD8|nr:YafY family protein [Paenibacillus sp. FSL H7-689]